MSECLDVAWFGPEAERWGVRLRGSGSLVVADTVASAAALEEATQRRRRAAVLTAPVLDEPRAIVAQRLAPRILERTTDRDAQRTMFDALAANALVIDGDTQSGLRSIDDAVKQTLRDLYLVGSATVVRSQRQASFLTGFFGRSRPGYVVAPGVDRDVPAPLSGRRGNAIVVWAPHTSSNALGIHLFALTDVKAQIVVIGCSDPRPYPNVRFVPLAQAQAELSRAALIIDVTLSDPASAVALANWNVPLAVCASSGADEFLDAVRLYDPWNWRSILAAVSAARGDAPPQPRTVVQTYVAPPASNRKCDGDEPLVSIVVPTFDRAELLPLALESLESQSYQNLEIIVINDAGPAVDDIVADFPRARCITNAVNCGALASCNIGLTHARGKYVGFLADDDIYYFDHVERLVAALEQSQAYVAHANALTRFIEKDAGHILRTSGNQVQFGTHLDVTEALWWGFLGYVLVRRDVFDRVGMFDETNAVADYEMFVRLSRVFDFVHVDHVTYEWRYRLDGSTLTHNVGCGAIVDGITEIFERYSSFGDSRVEKGRAATLAFLREHSGLPYWQPPLRLTWPSVGSLHGSG